MRLVSAVTTRVLRPLVLVACNTPAPTAQAAGRIMSRHATMSNDFGESQHDHPPGWGAVAAIVPRIIAGDGGERRDAPAPALTAAHSVATGCAPACDGRRFATLGAAAAAHRAWLLPSSSARCRPKPSASRPNTTQRQQDTAVVTRRRTRRMRMLLRLPVDLKGAFRGLRTRLPDPDRQPAACRPSRPVPAYRMCSTTAAPRRERHAGAGQPRLGRLVGPDRRALPAGAAPGWGASTALRRHAATVPATAAVSGWAQPQPAAPGWQAAVASTGRSRRHMPAQLSRSRACSRCVVRARALTARPVRLPRASGRRPPQQRHRHPRSTSAMHFSGFRWP